MESPELDIILRDLFDAFPNINSWVRFNSPDPTRTLRSWKRALRDVSFVDAWAVLDMMICGDLETLNQYELGRTAVHLRRHAMEIKFTRYEVLRRLEEQEQREQEHETGEPLPAGFIRAFWRLGQQARHEFPSDADSDDRKRWIDQQLEELGYRVEEN